MEPRNNLSRYHLISSMPYLTTNWNHKSNLNKRQRNHVKWKARTKTATLNEVHVRKPCFTVLYLCSQEARISSGFFYSILQKEGKAICSTKYTDCLQNSSSSLIQQIFSVQGWTGQARCLSRVRKKENPRTCTPSADKTDDEGLLVCYTVTELDWLMACNQAEWGIEFHSEFDRQMLNSLSNEIIWAKNWKAPLASVQGTGKRNRRVRQRQKAFRKKCFCVTVSSGLKNSLLDKGKDLGCLKKETAASPHQAFPQDQDGIPGCSQLFHTLNHPSLILRCDFSGGQMAAIHPHLCN